ncbi:MAG: glycosyltransferase family 4 protein [Candidatus Hydrogenedentota bacterium]
MKIKVLFTELAGEVYGGGQKSLYLLIKSLNRNDFESFLLTATAGSLIELCRPYCKDIKVLNIPLRMRSIVYPFIFNYKKVIEDIIKQSEISIIHCNDVQTAFLFSILKLSNVKTIYHCRVPHSPGFLNKIIDKIIVKNINRIIAVSDATAKRFEKYDKNKKIVVIPNGIDLSLFTDLNKDFSIHKKYSIKESAFIIGSVSRIIYGKRQHLLIEVLKDIVKDYPDTYLLIAGNYNEDKKYYNFLQNLIGKYNLSHKVIFTDFVENTADILKNIDVLSVFTYGEAMSRSILEGMACKKPIIASDDGGNPDIIKDEYNGLLVELDNLDKYKLALKRLLKDIDLRKKLSENAYITVQKYTIKNSTHEIENLYLSL